ncbi:MAG: hypothetical protein ACFCD0_24260 [Gemmataceae bacterium]
MSLWSWFFERQIEYEEEGDYERLRMTQLHDEAAAIVEAEPHRGCELLKTGQQMAEQLKEPWWAYLYEVWYILYTVDYKHDFSNILDDAIACYLRGQRPELEGHPWWIGAINKLIEIYLMIDAEGYAEEIEKALAHADSVIPQGPGDHRYVYLFERMRFYKKVGRLEEAWEVGQEHLDLVDAANENEPWYASNALAELCAVAFKQDKWDALAEYATELEALTQERRNRKRRESEALTWQAIVIRRQGDNEDDARRFFHRANNISRRIGEPPSGDQSDATAYFYQLANDFERALRARERELDTIKDLGMFDREAHAHVERCRWLAQLGRLTDDALEQAHNAANRLKKPESYRKQLDEIAANR